MSILGVIVRARPGHADALARRLADGPGIELGRRAVAEPTAGGATSPSPSDLDAEAPDGRSDQRIEGLFDGRFIAVIEDVPGHSAAATLGAITTWPEVMSTALVYEYSGVDSPAPDDLTDYRDWRQLPGQSRQAGQIGQRTGHLCVDLDGPAAQRATAPP